MCVIIELMRNFGNASTLLITLATLASIEPASASAELLKRLHSESPEVRAGAIIQLSSTDDPDSLSILDLANDNAKCSVPARFDPLARYLGCDRSFPDDRQTNGTRTATIAALARSELTSYLNSRLKAMSEKDARILLGQLLHSKLTDWGASGKVKWNNDELSVKAPHLAGSHLANLVDDAQLFIAAAAIHSLDVTDSKGTHHFRVIDPTGVGLRFTAVYETRTNRFGPCILCR